MTKFKRLASISSDKAVIAAALRSGGSSFIEVMAVGTYFHGTEWKIDILLS